MCTKVYSFIFRNNLNLASYAIKMGKIGQLTLLSLFFFFCLRHISILNLMGFNNQISQSIFRHNYRQNGDIQPFKNLTCYFD